MSILHLLNNLSDRKIENFEFQYLNQLE